MATELPSQLESASCTVLEHLSTVDISSCTQENYQTTIAALRESIIPNKGIIVPKATLVQFQRDCSNWENQLKKLFEEYAAGEKALVELGKEIGVGVVEGNEDVEDEAEFEALVNEIKKTGKSWIAKMDRMEKVSFRSPSNFRAGKRQMRSSGV